ncbi:thioredoxin family protein [Candidatus Obscuribacterales bacterium]|nr:thioredoxin family protein [Candidatus Obscuribacterales bacterium]
MKEFFIAFIIALAGGSIWNQFAGIDPAYQGDPQTADQMMGGGTGALGGNPSDLKQNGQARAGQSLVADIDEGSFQGMVLDSREPVLVEFYTDNCPHCRTMAPILGQLAYNGQGVVTVCKINAEKSSNIAARYEVRGVPAFVLFTDGHMIDSTSGARSFGELRDWLSQNNVPVPEKVSNNGIQL